MSSGPGFFSDFGMKTQDLLMGDYHSDQKFSVSTTSVTGVALSSSATNKRGVSTADIGGAYKHNNTIIGIKFNSQSNVYILLASLIFQILSSIIPPFTITPVLHIGMTLTSKDIVRSTTTVASVKLNDLKFSKISTTLTSNKIIPSTKAIASFELPDFKSSKLELQYSHRHATLTSSLAMNQSPMINISATIGTWVFSMGGKVGYETASNKFTNFTVGIRVNIPDHATASIILCDKRDFIRGSYIHYFDRFKKTAVAGEITTRLKTNKTSYTVGGCYAIDGVTKVKAKFASHGKISVLLKHEIIPKSIITFSTEIDTKDLHKTPRFGLALALKH